LTTPFRDPNPHSGRILLGLAVVFLSVIYFRGLIEGFGTAKNGPGDAVLSVGFWALLIWGTFRGGRFSLNVLRIISLTPFVLFFLVASIVLVGSLMSDAPAAKLQHPGGTILAVTEIGVLTFKVQSFSEIVLVLAKLGLLGFINWALIFSRDVKAYLANRRHITEFKRLKLPGKPSATS
jgi:hypothetical protein